MSRAQIRVDVNQKMTIDRTLYRVAEHPALPGIPYVQRGARGFVIQLLAPNGDRLALKYFKLKYRVPALVPITEALRQYADLPGLKAAKRTVFTTRTHADLLLAFPALEYGVLMPWLPGVTWYDIVTTKSALSPRDSIRIAQSASDVLASFEERGLAHCDIAGANVMVDRRNSTIELVDIEEMYGPNLPQPVEAPAGQDGYQHRTSRQQGQWSAEGDRFGASILVAEMLGWADARIRQNSADEHFFAASEMQDQDSPRYRLLYEVLRDQYSPAVAESFEQAWRSNTLAECPPIKLWREILDALDAESKSAQTQGGPGAPALSSPVVSGRRAIDGVPIVVQPNKTAVPDTSVNQANPVNSPQAGPQRLQLEGTKLCRNCGAQNPSAASFCKRCGFYIGSGARRAAPPPRPAASNTAKPAASASGPSSAPTATGTAPQSISLQRDTDEIIAARRVGTTPGAQLQRVPTPPRTPSAPQDQANFGSWIVVILVFATIIAIVALTIAGSGH